LQVSLVVIFQLVLQYFAECITWKILHNQNQVMQALMFRQALVCPALQFLGTKAGETGWETGFKHAYQLYQDSLQLE